ncbi:hypothetical protein BC628DRAFT_916226 [Trametes gibbosa]|nr:hypothetical protein BC628DRAFT_916226 [Trametes gibbosa]
MAAEYGARLPWAAMLDFSLVPCPVHPSPTSSVCLYSRAANMAANTHYDSPSLSGVLVVLNIALALVWVPVLDNIEDPTHIFHALLFVNCVIITCWIWMNTSLRAHVRLLCRSTVQQQAAGLKSTASPHPPGAGENEPVQASLSRQSSIHSCSHLADHDSSTPVASPAPALRRGCPNSGIPTHASTGAAAPHSTITRSDTPASPPSLSDPQFAEAVQILRNLHTLTRERDMYRTRAYELAMRLDDCYGTAAQTTSTLERAEGDVIEARRACDVLQAERRELTVALSIALSTIRAAAAAATVAPSLPNIGEVAKLIPISRAQSAHSVVAADATLPETSSQVSPPDERPLLLPPTSETSEDTPTRSRTVTWSSAGRSQSRLESIMLTTRRHAQAGLDAESADPGAEWDAKRAASARPIFSIVHEDIVGDRVGEVEEGPLTKQQQEKEDILEDLRMSRPQSPPSTSPTLESAPCNDAFVEVDSTGKGERVAPDAPKMDSGTTNAEPEAVQKPRGVQRRHSSDTFSVPVLRQPRGPPPSPYSSVAAKACAQAAAQRGAAIGHTWRGRAKAADLDSAVLAVPGAGVSLEPMPMPMAPATDADADSAAPSYPESRMPSRMRARQATAPPTSMAPLPAPGEAHEPSSMPVPAVVMPPMMITVGTLGNVAVGEEQRRRRHATFGASSRGEHATEGSRWQAR